MRMNKKDEIQLVPNLRFPEFKKLGKWEVKKLEDVGDFINNKISLKNILLSNYISTENILPDYSGITNAMKLPSLGNATRFLKNDILLSNIRPYLKKVWFADREGAASNDVIVIRANDNILNIFLSFHLKNDKFINFVMKGAKGVKMPRGDISLIKKYNLLVPSLPEQQKIADCLSSLDECISAETRKLESLRLHKKGLMQNLFPAEGESVPKLRFPEFKKSGKWEEKKMGDVCEIIDGDRGVNYPKIEDFSDDGYCLFLNAKNVTKRGFRFEETQFISKEKDESLRNGKLKREDIILTTRGSVGHFSYYNSNIPFDNIRINSGMVILRIKDKYIHNPVYTYIYSSTDTLKTFIFEIAFGNAQKQLTVGEIKKFKLPFPPLPEQQKIADCLSSLDECITSQSHKIASLKLHKKGLMQNLFPSMEDGN
jgi:type I restriction enzyme, S subunit